MSPSFEKLRSSGDCRKNGASGFSRVHHASQESVPFGFRATLLFLNLLEQVVAEYRSGSTARRRHKRLPGVVSAAVIVPGVARLVIRSAGIILVSVVAEIVAPVGVTPVVHFRVSFVFPDLPRAASPRLVKTRLLSHIPALTNQS